MAKHMVRPLVNLETECERTTQPLDNSVVEMYGAAAR